MFTYSSLENKVEKIEILHGNKFTALCNNIDNNNNYENMQSNTKINLNVCE